MKPPTMGRSVAGATAVQAGADFERELDQMHLRWATMRYCSFQKAAVQSKRIRGEWRVLGKSGPDRTGVYRGFPVQFDAKNRSGDASFRLKDNGRQAEAHEVRDLQAFSRAGGVAFILVRDQDRRRVYLIDSTHFDTLLGGGSVPMRDDLRHGGDPLLPCMEYATEAHYVRTLARSADLWPWPLLLPELPGLPKPTDLQVHLPTHIIP